MTLYLLKFNNYYNRIIKRINSINDVNEHVLAIIEHVTNFNPNDGISTKQIINYTGELPDYCVVCEPDGTINSQWFIIESVRTRSQQFEMTLYRDTISEWYDEIVNAPMFVEKATARIGDTAIFNSENMSYNQIKTSEKTLKDASQAAWIVGYLAKDAQFENPTISITLDNVVDAEYSSLDDYPYYKYNQDTPLYLADSINNEAFIFNYYTEQVGITMDAMEVGINTDGQIIKPKNTTTALNNVNGMYHSTYRVKKGYKLAAETPEVYQRVVNTTADLASRINWSDYTYAQANFNNISTIPYETALSENNKIIKVGNSYYQVKVTSNNNDYLTAAIPSTGALGITMKSITDQLTTLGNPTDPLYQMEINISSVYFELELTSVDSFTITIPTATNRTKCIDAPYDIFAIPFTSIFLKQGLSTSKYDLSDSSLCMKLAREIQKLAGSNLYDIQLLPFCPLDDSLFVTGVVDNIIAPVIHLNQLDELDYTLCTHQLSELITETRAVMLWIKNSNFTKRLKYPSIRVPKTDLEFKVANECDTYRLCSPNWNGCFEFSATKNMGVTGYRVDCSYKPINPYIRVAPIFNGLYGNIDNDARGLICGGDFSISQVSDAWLEYQRQNLNFQQIFDRRIENMEVNNSIQRQLEAWNVATGTIGAAAQAGLAGGMINPVGFGVGAAVGGVASLAGGLADIALNEQLRSEALDYTKDQFGYQLGNIKALPQSLTKVSSFNPNNKIFPILEYYTCTDIEKEALRNKIKYNGMTIMRIGTINEFIQPQPSYIKGKLIRLETIADDFHVVNTIADELFKGVFI